jgi:two-component system response regulator RegA
MADTAPAATERETVLVVDDDKAFCNALASALRRRGYAAVVAHNYEEALSEAEAWGPRKAVIDLRMPGKSGLELLVALKRVDPKIAIVVLTGYGSIATAIEAIKLGAVYYLTKPAEADDISPSFHSHSAGPCSRCRARTSAKPLDELEWEHLQAVLTDCRGNISEAARRLGMHRRSLQRKLARGRISAVQRPTPRIAVKRATIARVLHPRQRPRRRHRPIDCLLGQVSHRRRLRRRQPRPAQRRLGQPQQRRRLGRRPLRLPRPERAQAAEDRRRRRRVELLIHDRLRQRRVRAAARRPAQRHRPHPRHQPAHRRIAASQVICGLLRVIRQRPRPWHPSRP